MASKGKSRWADSEEDAALEAKLKREKEEKKRIKAKKAQRDAQLAAARQAREGNLGDDEDADRPLKRRKLTPERDHDTAREGGPSEGDPTKLLRFEGGGFGRCRSVENYDKLNDIEE